MNKPILLTGIALLLVGVSIGIVVRQDARPATAPDILRGHENVVSAVAFSPDGKWIASASMDHTVRLWDASNSKPGSVLRGHTDEVYAVAFAPNGRQLASTGYDRTVILWDLQTAKPVRMLKGFPEWSVAIAYAPDGRELAVGGMDGTVTAYDPASGKVVRTMKPQQAVTSLAFSPDGRSLATGLMPVVVSDSVTGKAEKKLEGAANIVSAVAYSPDGRFIAASSWDKTARVWDLKTGQLIQTIKPGMELPAGLSANSLSAGEKAAAEETFTLPVTGVAFSPDSKLLATAGADKTVRLWDVSTGKEVQKYTGHANAVTCVAFSPDGKMVASGSADKTIRVWRVEAGK